MRLEKKYPVYTFITNNNKKIVIDLSKNGEPIVGVSGKPLKHYPSQLTFPFAEVLIKYYFDRSEENKKMFEFYDRLYSYPNFPLEYSLMDYQCDELNRIIKTYGFKNVAEAIVFSQSRYFNNDLEKTVKLTSLNLAEEDKEFAKYIITHGYDTELITHKKSFNLIKKYLLSDYSYCFGEDRIIGIITDYKKYCEYIDENMETGDLFKNYKKARETFKALKKQNENFMFERSQKKYNLAYENDKFVVIVPTSRRECIEEGKALNNCLGGYEWDSYLKEGKRKVVFIRDKSNPNRPYIACDMDNSLEIVQFLSYNNRYVTDPGANVFKMEYANYLKTLV